MAWTTIRTAAALDLPAFAEPLEIHHDPEQHALLALDPATGESDQTVIRSGRENIGSENIAL